MTAADYRPGAPRSGAGVGEAPAMPVFLRRTIAAFITLAIVAAVTLFAMRGSAFIVDLYGLTGLSFCS